MSKEERRALKAQQRADLARARADLAREKVATARPPRSWVPLALGALAVLLAVGGVVGLVRAHAITSTPAAANRALVDSDATSTVEGEVGSALTRVLSYDYTKPDQTEASAKQFLTGKARSQYAVLFKALQEKAPGQQLTLTARVSVLGVKELRGDKASLLVFLDQSSTRASDSDASLAVAQIAVGATKVKGHWRISSLDPI